MTQERVESLLRVVEPHKEVLILPHNDPDPDAMASAVALRLQLTERLDIAVQISYRGIIGRAENKALVRYLDRPLRRLTGADLRRWPILLVDTQPGAGNNALQAHSTPLAVIDHHAWREASAALPFADVRPQLGATSTILTGYLQAAGIAPSPQLATALFYGIKADTMGLSRGASAEDVSAYLYLQPRIEVEALVNIERAQVSVEYFQKLDAALRAARIYGNVVFVHMGTLNRPDMAAEMADLLMRLQGIEWVICTGVHKDMLFLSIRTRSRRGGAGALAQQIVGRRGSAGGHGTMAGGQIRLHGQEAGQVAAQLEQLALQFLEVEPQTEARPILSQ